MADEISASRCLKVQVDIPETSLADLKQFVTEKGGRLIVGGKCSCLVVLSCVDDNLLAAISRLIHVTLSPRGDKGVNPRKRFRNVEIATLDNVYVTSKGRPSKAVIEATAKALKLDERQVS